MKKITTIIASILFVAICIIALSKDVNNIDHLTSNYELHKESYINNLKIIGSKNIDKKDITEADISNLYIDKSDIDIDRNIDIPYTDRYTADSLVEIMMMAALDDGKTQGIGLSDGYCFKDDTFIVDANLSYGMRIDGSAWRYMIAKGKDDIAVCVPYIDRKIVTEKSVNKKLKFDSVYEKEISRGKVDSWYLITALKVLSLSEDKHNVIRAYNDKKYGHVLRNDTMGVVLNYDNTNKMQVVYYGRNENVRDSLEVVSILNPIKLNIFNVIALNIEDWFGTDVTKWYRYSLYEENKDRNNTAIKVEIKDITKLETIKHENIHW